MIPAEPRGESAKTRRRAGALLSFLWLQASWFAAVVGAARGYPWVGPLVVIVGLSLHVRRQREKTFEVGVLLVAALTGFLVDTALLRFGVVRIGGASVSPLWLVALWPNFISTTAESQLLGFLPKHPLLAALLGALGGPLAYDGGSRLGAIEMGIHRVQALANIAFVWAVVVPLLVIIRRGLMAIASRVPENAA